MAQTLLIHGATSVAIGALTGYNERRRKSRFDPALALLCGLATVAIMGMAVMRAFI
ncbi:MAG: hypothetical protein Q7W05_05505 [Deltaproteobacteria bacterium]|nr:hypothetical protein [Deltaproteobacteria bacterium]